MDHEGEYVRDADDAKRATVDVSEERVTEATPENYPDAERDAQVEADAQPAPAESPDA